MRDFSILVALIWLFGRNTYAKSDKWYKQCTETFCCNAKDGNDLSIRFLLTFRSDFPSPLCTSTQRALEHDFIVSYNTLARLNCDKSCFRRAKDAHIVAAPENTFVPCGPNDPYYGGHRERQLATVETTSTLIIEVELEQAGTCTTALDGQTAVGVSANFEEFKDACGVPPWAWSLPYHHDVCYPSSSGYRYTGETCCCVCGTDRSLAESDLTKIHRTSHTLSMLRVYLLSARELFAREDCSGDLTVQFQRGLLLSFSDSTSKLADIDSESLFDIISNGYNDLTFRNCDGLGRSIVGGNVVPVDPDTLTRRRLQRGGRYVNSYSSRTCVGRACAAARVDATAGCPSNICPQTDDLDLFSGDVLTRTLRSAEPEGIAKDIEASGAHSPGSTVQDMGDIERVLSGASSTTTSRDLIVQECLCLTHEDNSTGDAPTGSEFVDQFNADSEFGGVQGLGTLTEAVELVIFPIAGLPKDIEIWLPIHIYGHPCSLDYKELQSLADLIKTSYNDIVVEDCDKHLFRQILSAVTWMDPHLNCYQTEFVVHVKLMLRCHGKCPAEHPLFGSYVDAYRRLIRGAGVEVPGADMLYDPANYNPELQGQASIDPDTFSYQMQQKTRREGTVPEEESGTEGVCFAGGARNPMPPTRRGLENRVNADLPTNDINSISILLEPLCRCEGLYEYFYVSKGPNDFKYFRTMNGIYVVPNDFKSCKYHRRLAEERELGVGAYPCSTFF